MASKEHHNCSIASRMRSLISRQDIGLVEPAAAGEHARVDAGQINHANMRTEFGQKRIKQIIGVAVTARSTVIVPGSPLSSSEGV
jgi:hypothetical protein